MTENCKMETNHDTNDDDPVVKVIPIFNSKRLQNSLYHFQYPLIPKNENIPIKKCLYKPNNHQFKLHMEINMESPNFDQDRAEILAEQVNGGSDNRKNDNKDVYFENNIVDKVYLKSTKPIEDASRYAAMAYNGREIHLTTLKDVYQFWPDFPYLDKSNIKRKNEHPIDEDDDEDEEDASEQVTVKFKKNDDRWKKNKPISFKNLQSKSEEEPWIECKWNDFNSIDSKVKKTKLIAENLDETGQATNLTDEEYIRVLVPEGEEDEIAEPALPAHVMSLHALRALPLQKQCKLLLKDAQIIQYQQLFMLLAGGNGLTAEALLKTLPKVAVLVRGNWVVKSDVLYPANTFSATSGVPAELMCRARDYVLYLFTKNQYVERKKVSSVMKLPSEELKEIFTGVSKLSHNKGWELALPPDQDFLSKHGETSQKQFLLWEQRFHQLSEFLKDNKEKKQRRKSKSFSEDSKVNKCVSSDDSGTEKNKSPISARKNKNVNNVD